MGKKIVFEVIRSPLSVLANPSLRSNQSAKSLTYRQQVTADADSRTEADNHVWYQHETGWSAEKTTQGFTFMKVIREIEEDPVPVEPVIEEKTVAPEKYDGSIAKNTDFKREAKYAVYTVLDDVLVRDAPGLQGEVISGLNTGDQVDVRVDSNVRVDGYVWVEHEFGWSSASSEAGDEVYMGIREDTETDAKGQPTERTIEIKNNPTKPPETDSSQYVKSQAATGLNVRSMPDLDGAIIGGIAKGEVIQIDLMTFSQNDGYEWVYLPDEKGYVAYKELSGTPYLVTPGSIPNLKTISNDSPNVEQLPEYKRLFTVLPIAPNNLLWGQYFGNNVFAFTDGSQWNYDGYSQGLHGGLDLGAPAKRIPVLAPCDLRYDRSYGSSAASRQLRFRTGDYLIIMQHTAWMANGTPKRPQSFSAGQQICILDPSLGNNTHLHFEIRYQDKWIINPLALMTDAVANQFIGKLNPATRRNDGVSELKYFYKKTGVWDSWTTPYDQPVIRLAGKVIGAKAK